MIVVAAADSRFLTGLSARFGMTKFAAACGTTEVAALPNLSRDEFVESHSSQNARRMGHPGFVVAAADSRFLDCERASAVADDLSSLGMTGFLGRLRHPSDALLLLRAGSRTEVVAFPVVAVPNSQGMSLWGTLGSWWRPLTAGSSTAKEHPLSRMIFLRSE
jgi:hypothetical protein